MRDRIVQPAPVAARPAVKDGAPGLSAFELARKAGFRGTLEQWLASLKGEPGEKGDPGVGKDGEPGRDLALVPALATFERDPDTRLTERVVVSAEDGSILVTITPLRDVDGFMDRAFIEPAQAAG